MVKQQHLVSRVKLGVESPCIELDVGVDPLMLRTDRQPYI